MNKIVHFHILGLFLLLSQCNINAADDGNPTNLSKSLVDQQCWQQDNCVHSEIDVSKAIIHYRVELSKLCGSYKQSNFVSVHNAESLPKYAQYRLPGNTIAVTFWTGSKSPSLTNETLFFDTLKKSPTGDRHSNGYSKQFEQEFEEQQNQEIQQSKNAVLRTYLGEACIPQSTTTAAVIPAFNNKAYAVIVNPTDYKKENFTVKIHQVEPKAEQSSAILQKLFGAALNKAAYARMAQED